MVGQAWFVWPRACLARLGWLGLGQARFGAGGALGGFEGTKILQNITNEYQNNAK